jgi:MinD-like ATPase involved in chromosome partitioning or flagellar assembly
MRRRQDADASRVNPPGAGWFGGHRKAREVTPPQPPAAPAVGDMASGKVYTATADRDFGNMANPLANGALRTKQQKVVWPFAGAPAPANAGAIAASPVGANPAAALGTTGATRGPAQPLAGFNPAESAKAADSYFGNYGTRIRAANGASNPMAYGQAPVAPSAPPTEPRLGAWAGAAAEEVQADDDYDYHVPKVLVLDRYGEFASDLARATVDLEPTPEVFRLNRPTQVFEVAIQEEPDVIVVAPKEVTETGLKRLAQVHREDPRIVIVLSDNGKPLSPSSVAACGTSDIIPQNPSKARLKARLVRALETADGLRKEHTVIEERVVVKEVAAPTPSPAYSPPPPVAPAAAPAHAPAPSYAAQRRVEAKSLSLARVFTVASASGGCGKTFYATNLAAYLTKATGGKVLLVDLDLQFGEVAISLHLRPKRTIAELVTEDDIGAALPDYLVDHSAGFKVLCAPKDPVTGDRVGPRETTAVLEAARSAFDYIVVDTPPSLNETCLAAFDRSQSLVIMATMDLPSLKNLRIFLETLKKLNLPADQVALVVNKAETGTGIDLKEVEPLYPQGFSAVLPYAKQVSWSINMGIPVLMADPNADISKKLVAGAMKLVPPAPRVVLPWSTADTTARRGWFSRLLKGKK